MYKFFIRSLRDIFILSFACRNPQRNVCFQVDTDNRETFPSLVAFSLFRKQRDSFYDILKTWEENHLTKDWIFAKALKLKINALLGLHTDPVNYCHFAKLFVSQLLVSSVQSGQAVSISVLVFFHCGVIRDGSRLCDRSYFSVN